MGAVRKSTRTSSETGRALTAPESAQLRGFGWDQHVGRRTGIWVRAGGQVLLLIRGREVLATHPCSTAAAGLNNVQDSFGTPTGWHTIAEKIGTGLPRGAILKARRWTGEIWRGDTSDDSGNDPRGNGGPRNNAPGNHHPDNDDPGDGDSDLILTRILRLQGLENGINRGGCVDSYRRCIYIHGTNHEAALGTPSSHGCVRLSNQDVIELFRRIRTSCPVLITQ